MKHQLGSKRKTRWWHTYHLEYSQDGHLFQATGSLWLVGLLMVPFTILLAVNISQNIFRTDSLFESLIKIAVLAFILVLMRLMFRLIRFSADKNAGTYQLTYGFSRTPANSGPLSDINYVVLAVHEIEDTDTHAVHPHYHLYLRIGEKDEHLFELAGSHWECLLQVRELAVFLGCGLQSTDGIPPGKEDERCTENPEEVRASLAAMYEKGPDETTIVRSASAGRKLRAAAVALGWAVLPYIVIPILAIPVFLIIGAVIKANRGDIFFVRDCKEVLKALVAILTPLSMIIIRYLHARTFVRWVEDNVRYRRNFLRLCIVIFTALFGLVAIHDYFGWEWAGMHSMDDYLGDTYQLFPIHIMQNFWLPDFFILLFLLRGTYRAYLHERLVQKGEIDIR